MLKTAFLLKAQHNGAAVNPLDDVLRDSFGGQSRVLFLAKVDRGEIKIPITRMEASRKAMVVIRRVALAADVDVRVAAAREEFEAISR